MLPLLVLFVVTIGLIFFFSQMTKRRDPKWERFRERQRERIKRESNREPDPNFQFDVTTPEAKPPTE